MFSYRHYDYDYPVLLMRNITLMKLNDLPQVTQLVSGSAMIWTDVWLILESSLLATIKDGANHIKPVIRKGS